MKRQENNSYLKIIFIISIILLCIISMIMYLPTSYNELNFTVTSVNETRKYHYIIRDTLLEIEDDKTSGYITLPKTYYVLSLGEPDITIEGTTYKKVMYNNVKGLVKVDDISKNSIEDISNPYFTPSEILSAIEQDGVTLWLYNSVPKENLDAVRIDNNVRLNYIAISSENTSYIYVKTTENTARYGYVDASLYSPTIIQKPNPNPINPDTPIDNPDLTPGDKDTIGDKTKTEKSIQTILIIILCLLVVFIIYLLFKPTSKKKANRDEFYDL